MAIEAKVEIGGLTLHVQDGQLLCYFPEGEGTSAPLGMDTYDKLRFIMTAAKHHMRQMEAQDA